MTNPFENSDGRYIVLLNSEGQYSLWPAFIDIPAGWEKVFGEGSRQECLGFLEESWTGMRPRSLVIAMQQEALTT
jgi:MbtH protein